MAHSALVTFVVGDAYVTNWRKYCAADWQAYASKHGMDLIPLAAPLDRSERASSRSISWQKCLVPSHSYFDKYKRLAIVDADVAINAREATNIFDQVSDEFVGGVISGSYVHEDLLVLLGSRITHEHPPYQRGIAYWRSLQERIYANHGLTAHPSGIIQGGVLVISPEKHGQLFRDVYDAPHKETRQYEQVFLSHALLSADLFRQIDTRFNTVFNEKAAVEYPYLVNKDTKNYDELAKWAVQTQFFNSFFLHFANSIELMKYLND
jgi:hypothetical protein